MILHDVKFTVIGKMPSSPYIICDGVDFFNLNIYFKNFKWTLSITSQFPNPHTSVPYNSIGLIVLSKSSSCMSSGKLKALIFFKSENNALFACSAMCCLALAKAPPLVKYILKYLYSLVTSISNMNLYVFYFPGRKTTIFVFSMLTVNLHVLQYTCKVSRACCISLWVSLNRVVSSA